VPATQGYFTYSGYANPDNLPPLNATRTVPEQREGYHPKWNGETWEYVQDMRGTKYYMPDGSEHECSEIEELLPEGASLIKPEPPEPTLDEARTAKRREITAAHDAFLKAQSEEYSEMERLTWDMQRTGADRLAADPEDATEPALLVKAIADTRGIPVADMVARIKENTLPWSIIAGHATGQRLKYQDALEACTTVEEVEAINPVFTLPE